MTLQKTLSILKPDTIAAKKAGIVIDRIYKAGFIIVGMKMLWLHQKTANNFYAIHEGKSFFEDLIKFMVSGPVLVQVLQREDAVACYRALIGETYQPKPHTLRAEFAKSVTENAVHGSDSVENAKREIAFFFSEAELCESKL